MKVGGRFRFGYTRRERRSPWRDPSATHPSQKAAKDEAPTVWFAIGRLGHPANDPLKIESVQRAPNPHRCGSNNLMVSRIVSADKTIPSPMRCLAPIAESVIG